jgi:hypothetical protein
MRAGLDDGGDDGGGQAVDVGIGAMVTATVGTDTDGLAAGVGAVVAVGAGCPVAVHPFALITRTAIATSDRIFFATASRQILVPRPGRSTRRPRFNCEQ